MGKYAGQKNMLGQNVIIQPIGAFVGRDCRGARDLHAPALYIPDSDAAFWQVFLSSPRRPAGYRVNP